jgi:hypothetical protein
MTSAEAVERLNPILAHAWMVRNFLKHAEEAENDEEILDVHRTIFDFIRAVEPSRERGDHAEYLRRLKNKLPKLRKAAEFFAQEFRRVSTHTNFEMAAMSLTGVVRAIEEIIGKVGEPPTSVGGVRDDVLDSPH